MQSNRRTERPATFTATARRAQIVAAAIETIADIGYTRASLDRIAERAGTSKGVVTYHFDGKADLLRAVVADITDRARAYMDPRLLAESTGSGQLRAYIRSNLEFIRDHRTHLVAVMQIAVNASRDLRREPLAAPNDRGIQPLERLLAAPQKSHEFRAFDAHLMALAIRAAIDVAPYRLVTDPMFDIDRYIAEVTETFDRATRDEPRPARARAARKGGDSGR